ncbi:hypothetical protein H0H92_008552 [Tricholoma furcatifolium]|nr:hypothetical protein H0H92_008552 [Tricholoma furcatifolium]
MAFQSPMISVPKKTTDEVDWTTPIRKLIAQSYGENPDNYTQECAQLQRCRQDAVRGAGSDLTARDLLYKYFGQLELLELRFPEIKVTFPWHDAFTNKLTTQTSIAFEKASILFQIAATHSAIASSQSRADPEGTKRAFYYFRSCAGMLTYINDNFLHAPSTDLSREVVKFLSGLILAQATEVFFEKCVDEKKGNALVAKVAAQAATMYTTLTEEVKEFMGKGIFDRNWVTIIQIKSKYFSSLSQYHRSLADSATNKHGDALVRLGLADTLAKEAQRLASGFSSSPTLPADATTSIQGLTKTHAALCAERKSTAEKENDLIYHALLPSAESLPKIEPTAVAVPVPIHEIYGTPEVQRTIGAELFTRLLPLSVHESASVYSEEKAKLVRAESENAEAAQVAVQSALEAIGVKAGMPRYRTMAEGKGKDRDEVPVEVRRAGEEVERMERERDVQGMLQELGRVKERVRGDLDWVGRELEVESRECEELRVRWDHRWTQEPSAGLSKNVRTELKSHLSALEAASKSDAQVGALWSEVKGDVTLFQRPEELEAFFSKQGAPGGEGKHLLDLDEEDDSEERTKIGGFVAEIEERLSRLSKIARERTEILKELKDKVQTDDVSHLLLLNRRNSGVEPTLFAAELEKFRPYQDRLAGTVNAQDTVLAEIRSLWTGLRDIATRSTGARKWDERERRKRELSRRFSEARDGYVQVRDGLGKGLKFYGELGTLVDSLKRDTRVFVAGRKDEREKLIKTLEKEAREKEGPKPPLAAKPPAHGQSPPPPPAKLEQAFQTMNLGPPTPQSWQRPQQQQQTSYGTISSPPPLQYSSPPPPAQPSQGQYTYGTSFPSPPPQPQYHGHTSPPLPPPLQSQQQPYQPQHSYHQTQQPTPTTPSTFLPPPPPPPRPAQAPYTSAPAADPYASLGMFDASASAYAQQPQQPQQQGYQGYSSSPYQMPPPPPSQTPYQQTQFPPPPPQQQRYGTQGYGR